MTLLFSPTPTNFPENRFFQKRSVFQCINAFNKRRIYRHGLISTDSAETWQGVFFSQMEQNQLVGAAKIRLRSEMDHPNAAKVKSPSPHV